MQEEIMGLARAAEERLNELHPDQHREYEMLQEESVRLNQEPRRAGGNKKKQPRRHEA